MLVCDGEDRSDACHRNMLGWDRQRCRDFFRPLRKEYNRFVVDDGVSESEFDPDLADTWAVKARQTLIASEEA